MGNVFQSGAAHAEHLLEVRLAPPHVEVPADESGQPCALFARVSVLGDPGSVRSARWDEATTVRLPEDGSAVLVTIFATPTARHHPGQSPKEDAHFVAEVCLPYAGTGGLAELGLPAGGQLMQLRLALTPGARCSAGPQEQLAQAFSRAREHYRKDRPHLVLSIRELPLPRPVPNSLVPDGAAGFPEDSLRRRQAIQLEFETRTLERRCQEAQGLRPRDDSELADQFLPSHSQQLQLILAENAQLHQEKMTAWQRLCHIRALNGDVRFHHQSPHQHHPYSPQQPQPLSQPQHALQQSPPSSQQLDQPTRSFPNWGRTLQVMQIELDHCRDRQTRITESYEEKLQGLRDQVMRLQAMRLALGDSAQGGDAPGTAGTTGAGTNTGGDLLQLRIRDARQRRDELSEQLYGLWHNQEAMASGGSPVSKVCTLLDSAEARRYVEQGQQYKAELAALQEELAQQHRREGQQELRQQLEQLYEQLDELHQVREDERVRSESEMRELRKERDGLRDRVDDAASEVKRLRAKAEAFRDMNMGASVPTSAASLVSFGMPSTSNLGSAYSKPGAAEQEAQSRELESLRQTEEACKAKIAGLEREQECLVEQMSVISSRAVLAEGGDGSLGSYRQALETRVASIEQQLQRTQAVCSERRVEVSRLRVAIAEAQERSESLRRSYDELQKISDERVLRTPQGAVSPPPTQCGGG